MKKYWVILNGVQIGPITEGELRLLPLQHDTPVWREGLADWVSASELEELAQLFTNGAYYPPRPTATPRPQYAPGQDAFESQWSHASSQQMPKTYLALSILATLFCCLPFGIVAIVYSTQVSSRFYRNDFIGAESASRSARNWMIASVIVGLVCSGLWLMLALPAAIVGLF